MAWVVLAAALLTFGGPAAELLASPTPTTLDLDASLLVLHGDITTSLANGAIMALEGASGELHAQALDIEIYPMRHVLTSTRWAGAQYSIPLQPELRQYVNATVRFSVQELGHVYLDAGGGVVSVPQVGLTSGEFFVSESDWRYWTPRAEFKRTEPMIAILQDPHDSFVSARHVTGDVVPTYTRINYDFPAAVFDHIDVEAPRLISMNRTTLTITHDGGEETIELGETSTGAGPLEARESRDAVLLPRAGRISLDLGGVSALAMGDAGSLALDGVVTIRDAKGELAARAQSRDLRGGDLVMSGRFEVEAAPAGSGGLVDGRPRIAVAGEGLADELRWNGAALPTVLSTSAERPSPLAAIAALATLIVTTLLRGALGLRIRDPLAHPKRLAILEALRRGGVLDRRGLEKATGLGRGTLIYHLGILSRHGAVSTFPWGDRTIYHLTSAQIPPHDARRLAVLTSGTIAKLARALVQSGAGSQADLAARAGLHPSTVSRLLRRLAASELVVLDEGNGAFRPAPLLVKWAESEG